jgi:hypothetical protein
MLVLLAGALVLPQRRPPPASRHPRHLAASHVARLPRPVDSIEQTQQTLKLKIHGICDSADGNDTESTQPARLLCLPQCTVHGHAVVLHSHRPAQLAANALHVALAWQGL